MKFSIKVFLTNYIKEKNVKIIKFFFGIVFGTQDVCEMKKKGAVLAFVFPVFYWLNWVTVGATFSGVSFLKHWGFSNLGVFLALWGANMLYSGSIVFLSDKSKVDFTLMEASRRLINKGIEKSQIVGYLTEGLVLFWLLIWEGPDQFILFFRSRIKTLLVKIIVFIVASGIQMAIWSRIYIFGYNTLF